MSTERPGDDELPPDPFPGDPFAGQGDVAGPTGSPAPAASPSSDDDPLAVLRNLGLGDLGNLGATAGLGGLGALGGMFGEVLRMAASQGPLNWDAARQVAIWTAAGGQVETALDPIERIRLEELCRIAEPHVNEATGLVVSVRGVTVVTHTRATWAAQALQDHRPLFEKLAVSMANPGSSSDPGNPSDPFAVLSQLLGPMMLSLQVGTLVGQLAQTSLATYDLPIPRPSGDMIGFVPVNIEAFAAEWTIPLETARMHVCLAELAVHAVFGIAHVRLHLSAMLAEYAGAYRFDPSQLAEQLGGLGGFDPSDPSSVERMFANPRELLGAIESPEQRAIRARINVLVATIVGYVEHVVAVTGARLLGDNRMVMEAWKRRRIESGEGERLAGEMLGLSLDQEQYDLGVAFIGGVIQRAGSDTLPELWSDPDHLPTRNELEAPGLWLARLGLDGQ